MIENSYLDVADEYEKKQIVLREKTRDTIKNGLDKIPKTLDCCFNCENYCDKKVKCNSSESDFSGQTLEDILSVCYYYDIKIRR